MKIKGTVTQTDHVHVEVEPKELLLALRTHLLEKRGLPVDGYLVKQDNGKDVVACWEEELYGSHTDGKQVIKVPHLSPNEYQLYKSLEFLKELLK